MYENRLLDINNFSMAGLASICDHTFLRTEDSFAREHGSRQSPVRMRERAFCRFIDEIAEHAGEGIVPYVVCVFPEDVRHARRRLDSDGLKAVKVASVVGFPNGSWVSSTMKYRQASEAILEGASELDLCMDYEALRQGRIPDARREIECIVGMAHPGRLVKLILETSELDCSQMMDACALADKCGVDFVKTSTGKSSYGATYEDLRLMRNCFSGGVKASGGITIYNLRDILYGLTERHDGMIELDPLRSRIGESGLLYSSDIWRHDY